MSEICTCGLLKVKKAGTSSIDGVEVCNICRRPMKFHPDLSRSGPIDDHMVTTLATVPGFRVTANFGVISELAATSGFTATTKGNAALANAMLALRRTARQLKANAIVGVSASTFSAGGGITNVLGGDAVGVLLIGTAVSVEPELPNPLT